MADAKMTFWILAGDVPTGPFTVEQIHEQLSAGTIAWTTQACRVGGSDWTPLVKVPGIGPSATVNAAQLPVAASMVAPAEANRTAPEPRPEPSAMGNDPCPAVAESKPTPAAESAREPNPSNSGGSTTGFSPGYVYAALCGLVFLGVSCGVLPTSCASKLPGLKSIYKDTCHECSGTGKTSASCGRCQGRGYYAGVSCSTCGGSGKSQGTCKYCNGSGQKPK